MKRSFSGLNKPEVIGQLAALKFKEYFQALASTKQNPSDTAGDEWNMKAILFNIAALTLKAVPHKSKMSNKRYARIQSIINNHPAMLYIKNNYSGRITIDDVARVVGYEKSNFCKQFKMATQTSFHKYLNSYRISIACNLIECSDDSMQAIGEKVGIPEAKSFSRIFKQVIGMTPTQYNKTR